MTARNLTPEHLRCGGGIHRLGDGRLLIVGEDATTFEERVVVDACIDLVDAFKIGDTDRVIVISPDLLADYVAEKVAAEREACAKLAENLAYTNPATKYLGPELNCLRVAAEIRAQTKQPTERA